MTDNVTYLREWAADIRHHNGKSVDADKLDNIAGELSRLRARVAELEGENQRLRGRLRTAAHALRSYQYNNASPDLAKGVADAIETILANEATP